ncbi:protein kinase domain-containing protein [Singulisphaera sp. PoT]|uniref:serine/threonine-protein kinase n=1 Tax=Singulisphaera sp. PoT TaxID=3411797 RepID=UPI003BF5E406
MSEPDSIIVGNPEPRIGSYRLLHSLGSGGMSSVFKAVHDESGHEVALKVLPRSLAKSSSLLQRFNREAKSAEALQHPNIVSIYDRGVDNGRHYLVLEYVEGGDLHDRVKSRGPLQIPEAVAIITKVAEGLHFASTRGLIHRDIKPANLLVTPEGNVKIIDLGLALQADEDDERVTREGTTVGTVDFMSPEQARDSRATNEKSDMYSLGCTLYFLLTGKPPFPGGDVADKLSRHCLSPPPDVRDVRPNVPAELAALVKRMMAKKADQRFKDYPSLIQALTTVPTTERIGSTAEAPIFALIEGDDAAVVESVDPDPNGGLFALVDDEPGMTPDNDGLPLLNLTELAPLSGLVSKEKPSPVAEVSLAELAALDDDISVDPSSNRALSVSSRPRRGETVTAHPKPSITSLIDEDEVDEQYAAAVAAGSRKYDDGSRQWITKWSLVGLGIICLVIGVHQLIKATTSEVGEVPEVVETETEPVSPTAEETPAPKPRANPKVTPQVVASTAAASPSLNQPDAAIKSIATKKSAPPSKWEEPPDTVGNVPADLSFGGEGDGKYIPAWAEAAIPDSVPGPLVTIRRVVDPRDPTQYSSLRQGLEVAAGTIEVADNGPFFEHDIRMLGEFRLIRARPGFRPLISIEPPQKPTGREQPAVFNLEGKSLILDGLDLLVDLKRLSQGQSVLFQSKGGSLTLRNCTVTVLNARNQPFALVRTLEALRPSRIRIETTLVRGGPFTVLELGGGSSEVVVNRSLLLGMREPLVTCKGAEPNTDRKLSVVRSILAGRGAIFDFSDVPSSGGKRRAPIVQAFASAFARIDGPGTTSLVVVPSGGGGAGEFLNWQGDHNRYFGWREWMVSESRATKLANLAAVRNSWSGSDPQSQEVASAWAITTIPERLTPEDFESVARDFRPTLARVASPTHFLNEKTLGAFTPPQVPNLAQPPVILPQATPRTVQATRAPVVRDESPDAQAKRLGFPVLSQGRQTTSTTATAPIPTPKPSPAPAANPKRQASPIREVFFDLSDSRWQGDLGRFLKDEVKAGDQRVRVRVRGIGQRECSPIEMPRGISLEVLPEHPPARGGAPLAWTASSGASGDALIQVRDADLVLSDVRLTRDGSGELKALVRVENGHIVLNRCWLVAPGEADTNGGNLISYLATSTRPLDSQLSPFETNPDRHFCRLVDTLLITGGDALTADVGRSTLALTNCAIAAGSNALRLRASRVARDRFDVNVLLDHCTVVGERNFVSLAPWPGEDPGPNRPILLQSRNCAFESGFEKGAREAVLLHVEHDSLDKGLLFWQSTNDAFDVFVFANRSGVALATNRFADVQSQWVDLWGATHMHSVTGATRNGTTTNFSTRLYNRIHATNVAPGDLALDSSFHPGRSRLDVGSDLSRLQILVNPPQRRRVTKNR